MLTTSLVTRQNSQVVQKHSHMLSLGFPSPPGWRKDKHAHNGNEVIEAYSLPIPVSSEGVG